MNIEGMPKLTSLVSLVGDYVNLQYTLPGGQKVKFLDDDASYLGCQLEPESGDCCFGVIANKEFILVSTYEENGSNPELIMYKKRKQ